MARISQQLMSSPRRKKEAAEETSSHDRNSNDIVGWWWGRGFLPICPEAESFHQHHHHHHHLPSCLFISICSLVKRPLSSQTPSSKTCALPRALSAAVAPQKDIEPRCRITYQSLICPSDPLPHLSLTLVPPWPPVEATAASCCSALVFFASPSGAVRCCSVFAFGAVAAAAAAVVEQNRQRTTAAVCLPLANCSKFVCMRVYKGERE